MSEEKKLEAYPSIERSLDKIVDKLEGNTDDAYEESVPSVEKSLWKIADLFEPGSKEDEDDEGGEGGDDEGGEDTTVGAGVLVVTDVGGYYPKPPIDPETGIEDTSQSTYYENVFDKRLSEIIEAYDNGIPVVFKLGNLYKYAIQKMEGYYYPDGAEGGFDSTQLYTTANHVQHPRDYTWIHEYKKIIFENVYDDETYDFVPDARYNEEFGFTPYYTEDYDSGIEEAVRKGTQPVQGYFYNVGGDIWTLNLYNDSSLSDLIQSCRKLLLTNGSNVYCYLDKWDDQGKIYFSNVSISNGSVTKETFIVTETTDPQTGAISREIERVVETTDAALNS